ncbi:hypothetical protein E4631_08455 [Hymenobacter sp. UV11]|uniref:hypothetical protein n=1 Tax=Hymenobacter sp. UV11 TaxID=1849735 RepID=UPI00105F5C82|nr:hypothetical protein [Hymenobacter sp. UV11]TDN36269.1 hypothetical protein A8B98_10160 [Hymenobacter sp. UV11]TFZ66978.1 hypothetical protein E4631_08455 [Hymenobacter sp. UV11]
MWLVRLLPDRYRRAIVGVFFSLLLVGGLSIVRDYGSFGDEVACRESGQISLFYLYQLVPPPWRPARSVAWLAALPRNSQLAYYRDRDYGVAFELPMTLIEKASGYTQMQDVLRLRHTCVFLVCFAGLVAFYWLATQRLGSWRAGLLGALLLVLSPRQFADFFYNTKDGVFLACCLVAMATAVALVRRPRASVAVAHALACAVAIDVRVVGVVLPACTLGLLALRAMSGNYTRQRVGRAVTLYATLLVLATVAFWPYLWAAPWARFTWVFTSMSRYHWDYPILHQGRIIPTVRLLPWSYAPVWLGITIPLLYLAGLLLSLGLLVRQLVRRSWHLYAGDGEWQDLLFWALGLGPLLAVIVLHSVLYDGWRQLYFVYPPLLLLALRGLVAAWRWQPSWLALRASWPLAMGVGMAVNLVVIGREMISLHPLECLYFNAFAGTHPELRYEYDYWNLSFRKGLEWIVQHDARPHIRVTGNNEYAALMNSYLLTLAEQARLTIVLDAGPADYLLTTYRFHWRPYPYGAPVYGLRVGKEGRRVFDIFRLPPPPADSVR